MAWYRLQVGIEHLSTGVVFNSDSGNIQIQTLTPSTFEVWSDKPFSSYWPVKNCTVQAETMSKGPDAIYSDGVAEYAAKRVATMLNDAWTLRDTEGTALPSVIANALIRKFGADTIPPITRGYPHYWFTHAGMFHGIEPDGYIHT